MSASNAMEEYLVSLGFKTDIVSLSKFEDGLTKTGKNILGLGKSVVNVVRAVENSAAEFAYSMRRVYFASELSNTTAKNLKAMQFAGEQFGVTGDAMASAIHGMAQAVRLNPGLQGLVESFGVKVQGRDMSDVMLDFVGALKKMPEYQGVQFASMFGIDADTYHQLIDHLDEIKKKRQELLDQYKASGADFDKQKKDLLEYATALDKVKNQIEALGVSLASRLSPALKQSTDVLTTYLVQLTSAANSHSVDEVVDHVQQAAGALNPLKSGYGGLNEFGQKHGLWGKDSAVGTVLNNLYVTMGGRPNSIKPPAQKPEELFGSLEQKYGLPAGLLMKQWGVESGYGENMTSPAGALGHFQFMPDTAKRYGLTDPNDLTQSATAAARYLHDLMGHYGGDVPSALAAYNWGEGNVDKKGLGAAPEETRNYVKKIAGVDIARLGDGGKTVNVNVQQNNTYHVNGTNAESTARAVNREQDRTWGDVTRNMRASVQ